MKQKIITIVRNDVYESIKNISAYTAAKNPDANGQTAYDKASIFDEDDTILGNLWDMSVRELGRLLNRYVDSTQKNATGVTFTLSLPDNAKANIIDSLQGNAENFLSYCMLVKWCDIASKEDAKAYEDNMQSSAQAIKESLYERKFYSRTNILNTTTWK